MTHNEFESLSLVETTTSADQDEEYSIPLDISDIISICREFNNLGQQIQQQVENILEVGVEESIKSSFVKQECLPQIKYFLQRICANAYFGDAVSQAQECIQLIQQFEDEIRKRQLAQLN